VNREKIHALFGLLFDYLQDDLAVYVLDGSIFDDLVDRHRPERNRTLQQQLLAYFVEISSRAQVHHRIGAGVQGGLHLLEFALHRTANVARTDVGVDLRAEHPSYPGRREISLQMQLVGGNRQPTGGKLVANNIGINILRIGNESNLVTDCPASCNI